MIRLNFAFTNVDAHIMADLPPLHRLARVRQLFIDGTPTSMDVEMADDDFSLYDDEEPTLPLREKAKAYPKKSKEAASLDFLMEDMENGRVVDARQFTGFPTLLRDGIVTPDGLFSEEFLEEMELYKEYHERRGREIRARRKRSPAEGVVTHVNKARRQRFMGE